MRVLPLGTGLGKSTSAYSVIAAGYQLCPEFSATYVAPTIKMAIEAQEGIERLLGNGTTALWTSLHKHKEVDLNRAINELGEVPSRTMNKADLPVSRVAIVTHSQLLHELKTGRDEGAIRYQGSHRSIVFIDENPDWVEVVTASPAKLQTFHDMVVKHQQQHPWLSVIPKVVAQMSDITQSQGQSYIKTTLLTEEEGKVFDDDYGLSLWEMTDEELSNDVRGQEVKEMRDMVTFLRASSKGNSFYSRRNWEFYAYQLHFNSDYPGFVLLDATSDLTSLASMHPKVASVEVPTASYDNLELFHLNMPKRFKNHKETIGNAVKGREYGQFIRQSVLANTVEGDEVLVVARKSVFTEELIQESNDPDNPLLWGGRKVNTLNWGTGVGVNKFRHKTHVFLFGDYYMPRAINIAKTHGWSLKPLTDEVLKKAEGKRKTGDIYIPQGDYLKTHIGHLLSWAKQLAMRGQARQVDTKGVYMPMKLLLTMDLNLLLPHYSNLFLGAPVPLPAKPPSEIPMDDYKGREGLIRLLMSTTTRPWLGADEIEAVTGIQTSKLTREFEAIGETIAPLGWRLSSAKEIGKGGKMRYVVNDKRLLLPLSEAA